MIDTHVHIANFQTPQPDMLLKSMDAHGVDRLVLFSEEPAYWETDPEKRKRHNAERLDRLFAWCQGSGGRLLPVSFINPTEPDAMHRLTRPCHGAIGFKIICETFTGDERALPPTAHCQPWQIHPVPPAFCGIRATAPSTTARPCLRR